MSIPAQKWAMEQKGASCSAKFVLVVLATFADVTGACWPSQETLATATNQSVATVQRCLRQLEELGLLCIGPRRVKKNGHAGTRQYVLLHDSWCVKYALEIGYDPSVVGKKCENSIEGDEDVSVQDDSENQTLQIAASGENGAEENQEDGEKPNENRHCNLQHQDPAAQTLQIAVSADTSLAPYQEQPYLNLSPKVPTGPSPVAALDDGSWLTDMNRLVDAWPWADGELIEPVRKKFRELEPSERDAAVEQIPAYLAECKRRGCKPMSARSWVSRKGWEPFVLQAKKRPTMTPGKSVPVIANSPPWKAWLAYRGVASFPTRRGVVNGKPCDVWDFPTLWPPGASRDSAAAVEASVSACLASEIEMASGAAR